MAATTERPELTFDMFRVGTRGSVQVAATELQRFFGKENYALFRDANKRGEEISAETRLRVDREVYAKVGKMFQIVGSLTNWKDFWESAMGNSNITVNYARGIFFADQDKQATLTTDITWGDYRPSSALETLTTSTSSIGTQYKYEQGRQLGLALLCAEVMRRDENGNSRIVLNTVNNFLTGELFLGKRGDPKKYHVYSYHTPNTNRLMGLGPDYPDPDFEEGLWVKSLHFPVRMLGIRNEVGEDVVVPALYDPRDKDIASAVIKAKERSLMVTRRQLNGGLIETSRYAKDQLGFRLVVMEGGRPLRDRITSSLEELFRAFEGVERIEEDDKVDASHGDQDRIAFRRRLIYLEGLNNPIELVVYSLKDWITSEYEVGNFSTELGMHDGRAHDLYKLRMVGNVAEYLWPYKIFGIDLAGMKKESSHDYAARLSIKQRIHPSPYLKES